MTGAQMEYHNFENTYYDLVNLKAFKSSMWKTQGFAALVTLWTAMQMPAAPVMWEMYHMSVR